MQIFRQIPFVKKLMLMLIVAGAVAVVLASASFHFYQQAQIRKSAKQDVSVLGKIALVHASRLVAEKNLPATKLLLESLATKSGVVFTRIEMPDRTVFAESGERSLGKSVINSTVEGLSVNESHFVLRAPISQGSTRLGTFFMVYDASEPEQQLFLFQAIAAGMILTLVAFLAHFLSGRLDRFATAPLGELRKTAEDVTESQDLTLRVAESGDSEMGAVTGAFNRMLDSLQERDAELQKGPQDLEKKVRDMEHEISERKRVEEDLRAAEIKYRTLVEQLPVITYNADCNQSGAWFYVSPQIEGILGFTQEEWVGNPKIWEERLHADDMETFNAKATLMDRNGDQFICEYRIYDRYGRLHWFRDQSAIVRDPVKNQSYTHGFLLDVTEQKQAEMELDTLQLQLLDISRQAGMAEVATGVLHNVGNVLNSVNVSSTILSDLIKNSKLASLSKVTGLLREHTQDLGKYISTDPKGKQLPTYLVSLTEHLSEEHVDMVNELVILIKNVEHIKHIVSMQQSYAKVSGMVESVSPKDLVEDALQINAPSFSRNGIKIVRTEDSDLPNVSVEKHKVLQILVNLLRNSKNAMEEVPRKDRKITVGISVNGDNKVKITVRDQGCGIEPDNLTRIFSHGFTTKTDGHGFGLHIGALAAQEMGGSLMAESDGPGKGAAFVLELPAAPTKSLS